ncbi:ketopantoate reductase family protein [Pseudoalteromonas denitrificans]|uniref:2-dehydropantoate 2-reductase n=1 Tax=Pseudoalteromonas denitrificans DSM 6059 TaxID=1123010 RepID=A0A1I1RXZ9_9GAMM|nr:2-dehydropantoate 2-reductase [Pseudoalteromonas denitrificans]SFD37128.1 2-dehydropantoate 2-reductase [Pseudoalteromonas denitrificans DSM 6059]
MKHKKSYLVFGAGAIGTTIAAWLNNADIQVNLFDKQKACDYINQYGVAVYLGEQPEKHYHAKIKAYSNLDEVPTPDVIVLCIKNYSLAGVSEQLVNKFGKEIPVVALQNGIENQQILPQYFDSVIYGVVCFNAWVDDFGKVGYQKKGPLALGHNGGVSVTEMNKIITDFNKGVETFNYPNLNDAVHSKIVINLTNSLTTLVALHKNDQSKSTAFQKLLTSMTYEGIQVMKAAGFKESKLGGMPSWLLITAARVLPCFITRKPYLKNLKKMVISSMAQDIIVNGGSTSELDSINGYVLSLAKKYGIKTPINDAIYKICQEEFVKSPFEPVTVDFIWQRVEST